MLIRSQDKESLVNLSNIESVDIIGFQKTKDGYFQCYESADLWKVTYSGYEKVSYIGEYASKQNAIKVLDLIQQAYESSCEIDAHIPGNTPYMRVYNTVFQMPQDKEVSEE